MLALEFPFTEAITEVIMAIPITEVTTHHIMEATHHITEAIRLITDIDHHIMDITLLIMEFHITSIMTLMAKETHTTQADRILIEEVFQVLVDHQMEPLDIQRVAKEVIAPV